MAKHGKVRCKALSPQGESANCVTVGEVYNARFTENGLGFWFDDNNGVEQFGLYPSCAFGEWEKVDDED